MSCSDTNGESTMPDELDPNAIAADFLKQNLDDLVASGKQILKGASDRIRLRLQRTYTKYLTALMEKYSKAKSFLLRGDPAPLYDFYVPLDLKRQDVTLEDVGVRSVLNCGRNIIITGSGGSGKSMLIRHLL